MSAPSKACQQPVKRLAGTHVAIQAVAVTYEL
jgi:hypothetical protein